MSDYIATDSGGRITGWTFDEKYATGFIEVDNLPDDFHDHPLGDWLYVDGTFTNDGAATQAAKEAAEQAAQEEAEREALEAAVKEFFPTGKDAMQASIDSASESMTERVSAVENTANVALSTAEAASASANPQIVTFATMALASMAPTMTDDQAVEVSTLWPKWRAESVAYAVDQIVRWNSHLWRCVQAHTSQESWTPDAAPSLWSQIDIAGDGVEVWTQPTGAHNCYNTGDRVHYPTASDPIYVSTIDGNVWSPDAYPQGWQLEEVA